MTLLSTAQAGRGRHQLIKTRRLPYAQDVEIDYQGGWIWRDGKIIRLKEEHWRIDAPGERSPQDAAFIFPELKKNDIVCYAVEADAGHPFTGRNLRLSCDLPVMICNANVKTGGFFSLEFLGHNLTPQKFSQKIYEEKDGFPVDSKFTVVDIPADRTGPDAPPFYEYQPHLTVYPKAQFNPMSETWMAINSWNMVAVQASGLRQHLRERIPTVKARAQQLTAGLETDTEKADALYRFVQDDLELVCFFDDYHSQKFEDILARGKANRMSKSALLYAMGLALELPVDVLLCRDSRLGKIDLSTCVMNQFTDFVVLLKGEPDRYYAPSPDPCAPGELPEGLRGLRALSTKPDLSEPFRELAMEASSRSSGNPESASAIFNGMLGQQKWSEWVTLPK